MILIKANAPISLNETWKKNILYYQFKCLVHIFVYSFFKLKKKINRNIMIDIRSDTQKEYHSEIDFVAMRKS